MAHPLMLRAQRNKLCDASLIFYHIGLGVNISLWIPGTRLQMQPYKWDIYLRYNAEYRS